MRRSSRYYKQIRHDLFRIAIVWAAIIGTCYYVYICNKCVQHYREVCRGNIAIITLFGE